MEEGNALADRPHCTAAGELVSKDDGAPQLFTYSATFRVQFLPHASAHGKGCPGPSSNQGFGRPDIAATPACSCRCVGSG